METILGSQQQVKELLQESPKNGVASMSELFEEAIRVRMQSDSMTDMEKLQFTQTIVSALFVNIVPWLTLLSVIMAIVTFVASAYFMELVLADIGTSEFTVVKKTVSGTFTLVFLSLWMGIRSFGWVPVIGPLLSILYLPRFVAAPLLCLRDRRGLVDSVATSMRLTQGLWFWVSWKLTFIAAVGFALVLLPFAASSFAPPFLHWVIGPINAFAMQIMTAVTVAYVIELSKILAPPQPESLL